MFFVLLSLNKKRIIITLCLLRGFFLVCVQQRILLDMLPLGISPTKCVRAQASFHWQFALNCWCTQPSRAIPPTPGCGKCPKQTQTCHGKPLWALKLGRKLVILSFGEHQHLTHKPSLQALLSIRRPRKTCHTKLVWAPELENTRHSKPHWALTVATKTRHNMLHWGSGLGTKLVTTGFLWAPKLATTTYHK